MDDLGVVQVIQASVAADRVNASFARNVAGRHEAVCGRGDEAVCGVGGCRLRELLDGFGLGLPGQG